jgi:hypothetical protein
MFSGVALEIKWQMFGWFAFVIVSPGELHPFGSDTTNNFV